MTPSKRKTPLLWIAALVLLATGCGTSRDGGQENSAASRGPAPSFLLKDLSGRPVSLSDFKGRVVLLDFWATWCPPCRESIPALVKLYDEYESRGLQVLGISMDDDASDVERFVRENRIRYPVLLGGESNIGALYRVRGIPTLYILDEEGRAVRHWVGYDSSLPAEWRRVLDRILPA